MFNNFFFKKMVPFMRYCGKILYSRAGQRWQHGACALHAIHPSLYKRTLRMCYSYCFSTATTVTRTCLNVTLQNIANSVSSTSNMSAIAANYLLENEWRCISD